MRTVPAPQTLRAIAEEAARTVAPDLLAVFRAPMTISTKRDAHDVVTLHDRAAEEAITAVLTAAVPGSVVLGEEGGTTGDTGTGGTAGDAGDTGSTADPVVRWIVDPIDGTANFARGLAYWCISIAAEVDGEVVAGVVFDPVADHVFAADDDGAWLDGAPMHSSSGPDDAATVLTSFPVQQDLDLLGEAAAFDLLRDLTLRYRHHHSLGSGALNLVHVAAGWSDVTMGFATHPWDVAAGALVLERAGGWFRGFRGGEVVDRAQLADDYVAAGAGGSHAELVRRVQELSATTAAD
ncbi:inositol monophosphatase family protein [Curtobacterium flaccumfaciens]|uniref:inositol monophosphatase family protein n=1 Tax=Curtobacterium flaccumfaciens TaxID=2035 RepID=UPI00217E4911|nr:inositol monophosphatase [Curtobacterium flaccumfaciens]MCS6553981.1 inositol monophosphatase [Curtobacterium flaccumfaciens]